MVARTQAGFEQVLAAELASLGAGGIEVMRRAVAFQGDREMLYRANLHLRTALRILIPVFGGEARTADELYRLTRQHDWTQYITPQDTLAVDTSASGSLHTHTLFTSMKVKDAVVDQFREWEGSRPSVDLNTPTLRIHVHVHEADVMFALDASGDSLHRRGYRLEKNAAPLNEVTAAGMLLLTGWDGNSDFGDILCGSGTLIAEAAWIAMDQAPGLCRPAFGFQRWKDYDAPLWERLVAEARARIHPPRGRIFGSDISSDTLRIARRNLDRAGVMSHVKLRVADFRDARPPGPEGGILVLNPPYGDRIGVQEIADFYALLGDTLKQHFQGYQAWILSGNPEAMKRFGLRATQKIPLLNGAIDCRFQQYELYAGSRREAP